MEPKPFENTISTACVGACKEHAVDIPNWTRVTVVGNSDTALADVYQVAVAGVGGTATHRNLAHGVVAVASTYGHAISGDGGVAVSSGGGESKVEKWGYAYAKNGKAYGKACSVAATAGGYAEAADKGIGIGWFSNTHAAKVEAGKGGVVIGQIGSYLKVGAGGAMIAIDHLQNDRNEEIGRKTKICRAGEGEISPDVWYLVEKDGQELLKFTEAPLPLEWIQPRSPCPV
jgi:hypothetical protein